MKIALLGYGKMGQVIERIALERGHEIVLKKDETNTFEGLSNADVAIVCSTDSTYPELAPAVTSGIKAVKPSMKVFLAGAPTPELKKACDEAGMDDYISVRSNCYETLLRMQKEKGMIE